MSVDLPEPDTPVTQTNRPTGRCSVTFCRLLPVAPVIVSSRPGLGAVALGRNRNLPVAREILAGQRMRRAADVVGRALRDDLPAVLAGARPHVDHVVGGVDRVLVVLDDDDAVAEVAQVLERGEQAVVVALVQADRRLVQHVHDAGQPRADLRGETDALRLAARQRFRRAVERQVVEADVVQELQPAHDLLDDAVGDRGLLAVEPASRGRTPSCALSGSPEIS